MEKKNHLDERHYKKNKEDHIIKWYKDEIWGKRIQNDNLLFEVMSLQIFQAGLKWKSTLLRRDEFRAAFNEWKIEEVALFEGQKINQMVNNSSIIRNRNKIEACIKNAEIINKIKEENNTFCNWFYNETGGNELKSLQKIMIEKFKFMGPEIARMWLMASGRI
tara:strand:+ start:22 stop:510 length:489 start_codon:yes stop_codon:yes gene_type:complete